MGGAYTVGFVIKCYQVGIGVCDVGFLLYIHAAPTSCGCLLLLPLYVVVKAIAFILMHPRLCPFVFVCFHLLTGCIWFAGFLIVSCTLSVHAMCIA